METYEDDLIEWYWKHQEKNLTNWFCIERVLDPGEDGKELAGCTCWGAPGDKAGALNGSLRWISVRKALIASEIRI